MTSQNTETTTSRRIAGFNMLDVVGGAMIFLVGVSVVVESLTYSLGSMRNIGPGMFPLLLGVVIAGLGVAVIWEGRISQSVAPPVPWRPILAICAGLGSFGLLIDKAGAFVSIFALIFLSGLAERRPHFIALFFVAIALCLFTAALVMGFRGLVNMHLWPEF